MPGWGSAWRQQPHAWKRCSTSWLCCSRCVPLPCILVHVHAGSAQGCRAQAAFSPASDEWQQLSIQSFCLCTSTLANARCRNAHACTQTHPPMH